MSETTETKQEAQQEAPATTAPAPDLNLNDLAAIRNLIEVVTQRGVFKANELSSAGTLYDKLTAFLNAAQAQSQAQQPQESQDQPA
jgi:hypothetical protein